MKKLIFAIVSIVCGVCSVNAGELQEMFCGDKSLSYCIRHFEKQCNAKNYGACLIVGELHYEQEQYNEAKQCYELVCDKANSQDSFRLELIDGSLGNKVSAIQSMQFACGNLAKHYHNGLGVRQDFVKSLQYFKKACDLGDADSCAGVGLVYSLGESTKTDYESAKSYFEKSCEMKSAMGYGVLGAMYHAGEGVPQNLYKAKELYGKACDLGEQKGCDDYKELNEKGVK